MNTLPVLASPPRAWTDDTAWDRKLARDADAVGEHLPPGLRALHELVVSRARSIDARALILSGSTARGCRTEVSDLDYHLIGSEIDTSDLSLELDIHTLSEKELHSEIVLGDDFIQWSLRFGCVVFDDGTARRGLRLIDESRPWPDVERKRDHAVKSLALAERFVATGDEDGALEQVRTALSLAARAKLLQVGVFPLCRAEMPLQLDAVGHPKAARALTEAIHGAPTLEALSEAVHIGRCLL